MTWSYVSTRPPLKAVIKSLIGQSREMKFPPATTLEGRPEALSYAICELRMNVLEESNGMAATFVKKRDQSSPC